MSGGGEDRGALPSVYEGFLRFYRCMLPTVAAVNGPAVGAGMNLALACDIRVASPAARFDCRFARIGLHPGGGHTRLLTEAVGPQAAAAMVLAGESPDGARAAAIGLAWTCVDDGDLLDEATRLAGRAADLPRELARRVKASLRETPRLASLDDAVALELERQRWSLEQGFFAEQRARAEARRERSWAARPTAQLRPPARSTRSPPASSPAGETVTAGDPTGSGAASGCSRSNASRS